MLQKEYNFKVNLNPKNKSIRRRRSTALLDIFHVHNTLGDIISIQYGSNTTSTIEVQIKHMPLVTIPVNYPEKYNEIDITQFKSNNEYYNTVTLNGIEYLNSVNSQVETMLDVTVELGDPVNVKSADLLNAREVSTAICGDGAFLENIWLVDGTGSYTGNIPTAKSEFIKNRDYLIKMEVPTKLGISFFADRDHDFSVAINALYLNVMPLTDVGLISNSMIEAAFNRIRGMGGGGDGPEDALLGLDFTFDTAVVKWGNSAKVKLVSVFTDNPFHVEFDAKV